MKAKDLYSISIANWLSKGNLVNRERISSVGIKPGYNFIYTKLYVTKVFPILDFPVAFKHNIISFIYGELLNQDRYKEVLVSFETHSDRQHVPVNSDVFKRQFSNVSDKYSNYKEMFSRLKKDEKMTGKQINIGNGKKFTIKMDDLRKLKELYDSYTYVYRHTNKEKGEFGNCNFFIKVKATNKSTLQQFEKDLIRLLRSVEVFTKGVSRDNSSYLSNFGTCGFKTKSSKSMPNIFTSDENLASQLPFQTRGLVGGYGTLLGVNWENKLPFLVDFFESAQGQILMLLAKTGYGKTYAAYQLCLSLLQQKVHCSAIDLKGKEWDRLLRYVRGIVISLGENESRFVNTLRLDDIECTNEEAPYYYSTAVKGTINLLTVMTNLQPNEGNLADLDSILDQAISKVFSLNGIDKNNSYTFSKTRNIKYSDVLNILTDLRESSSYNEEQRNICGLIRTRCGNYFQSEGRYANAFKNEITVSEILDSPLVIYSLDKNNDTSMSILDTIKVCMIQYLDTKKQAIRKSKRLHTAAFYEEIQRCSDVKSIVSFISHSVTGSRSNNVMIILLLNAINSLNSDDMKPIKSNITTYMVGNVSAEDAKELETNYDFKGQSEALTSIRDDIEYRNCFRCKYNTGKSMGEATYKVVFPKKMSKELETRDVIERKEIS